MTILAPLTSVEGPRDASREGLAPIRCTRSVLTRFLGWVVAAQEKLGTVEVGALLVANADDDRISSVSLLRGQEVDVSSFQGSDDALAETLAHLERAEPGRRVVGVVHYHPHGPFGHSFTDVVHIERLLLGFIAGWNTVTFERKIEIPLHETPNGPAHALDPLRRASLRTPPLDGAAVDLHLTVAESTAVSLVVVGPPERARVYGLRQRHIFVPIPSWIAEYSGEELFHHVVQEEPEVCFEPFAEAPVDEESPAEEVRRWVRRRHSEPREEGPSREALRQQFRETLREARSLARSAIQLVMDDANRRLRAVVQREVL